MKTTFLPSLFLLILLFPLHVVQAQIGINSSGNPPNASAMLDVDSDDKGFLMPRMKELKRLNIVNPAKGLAVFQIDGVQGIYVNEGDPNNPQWVLVGSDSNSATTVTCEARIPIDSIPFTINSSGSYYLTRDLVNTVANADGITVSANNVSINLNGFTLSAGAVAPGRGIDLQFGVTNITILNGTITGWFDGIYAINNDYGYLKDLTLIDCPGNGAVVDNYWTIEGCHAFDNDNHGIFAGSYCIIDKCISKNNLNNGIFSGSQCVIRDCLVRNNDLDGISLNGGGIITHCVSGSNGQYGFRIGSNSTVYHCTSNNNGYTGFYFAFGGYIEACEAFSNGAIGGTPSQSGGIRMGQSGVVKENSCYYNAGDGIGTSSVEVRIEGNTVVQNSDFGIQTSGGNIIIRNRASNNSSGNYSLNAASSYGPIVNIAGAGDMSAIAGSNHPMANFEY